ncbi:hypothetical protein FXF51_19415 [Nonomuraea sp. PA05]|uniref:CU044_5270 family protein n=1 Tax=Nonomuraea sp. PA05 TaxID=2604466 RepID=UPI0011D3BCFD|nr:CU044_5270 family protein [Nonomuraea sp. PA05]TYB65387.1 hypothetical protein FXF51_19415 [Nonomuraea sp. PA05]
MDELELLARSLPDAPPPSPEVVGRAHARLTAAMERPARRRSAFWGWTATATVAVVTAVVSAVTILAPAPAPVIAPPGGNDALLRLADDVARLPETTGPYWLRPLINGSLLRVEAGGEAFNVLSASSAYLWQPRDPDDPVQARQRQEYVRPATPADERVWKAAGSPAEVARVCTPGTPAKRCGKLRLGDRPASCVYTRTRQSGVLGDRRLGELTPADLAALPADVNGLRERLRRQWQAGERHESFEEFLPRASWLLEMPIGPRVRAAVLRLLAGLPTTTVGGTAEDPLGRRGLAVTFVKSEGFAMQFGADDEVAERYTTILDPRTGAVLVANASVAAESVEGLAEGTYLSYQAWTDEAGWTSDRPERPRGCRLSSKQLP